METDLVLLAPGDEQDVRVLGVQERGDGVFPPPLPPVWRRLAPAVVVVGGLVPERGQLTDHALSHVRANAIAVLAVTMLSVAGCGGSPGYQQAVRGTFVRVGGPAPGSPFTLPGTITARAATGGTFTATAGPNGCFTLSLPPGRYRVTGRSPLIGSGQAICAATPELHVTRGKAPRPVTVVCSIS